MKNSIFNAVCKTRYLALLVSLIFTCAQAWGTTIASWGRISIAANTDYKASDGDANNKNVAKFSSNKAMNSGNGTYCYYGSAAGGAVITFSNLNLSGYTGITMTFYTRASKQGNMKIQYTTNGSTWTDLDNPGPSITKSEAQKTSSTIPNTATGIKLTHSASSGSLYFGTIVISGTAAASCGVPTSPTNGSVTASTQPVSWTAPGSAPANGYLVAVGTTSTAPADNVQINNGQAYTWGDHFVSHVAAGTTSFTFGVSQGVVEGTQYHWWVRSKCSSSDYSAWVEGTAFTIPSSCSNTVTINKGTSTNCSFTLSPSGAQESCDGVTTTVSITPTTGYGNPSVTQSGASKTPTITGSGTSWTVTYSANTTGTSVINVSCSAKTTTVSFNQNGGEGGQTTSKTATYGQAMPTPITTPTRTGYTFGGYYDGSGGTGNKYYNANGSSAATWNKDAATATLYAKWTANTYTVSWSVNGSVTSTTPGVSYNTTTSTPANPSVPSECTGSTFMGWTSNSSWASDSAPGDLFNGTSPTITGNITFYAVFADEN